MSVRELTTVTCYHCGDVCAEDHRVHDSKDFCCHGCEVVYDLLNESGLCDYYALEKQARREATQFGG
jgi:Cu+-exporting ATPase